MFVPFMTYLDLLSVVLMLEVLLTILQFSVMHLLSVVVMRLPGTIIKNLFTYLTDLNQHIPGP